MQATDLGEVIEIEQAAFSTPWSRSSFEHLIDEPLVEAWVAEDPSGSIVAHGVAWCASDQAELANIAVSPAYRSQGVGGRFLDHLMATLRGRGARSVFLEVRQSNAHARQLYEGRGFHTVGIRRDYYATPREDARVMRKTLA